ncbi:MAG TPA: FAD-binding protein, partial [Candidatus Limnocylindria bacterium]|nr:FAD-binding protein [Candidatus Limnocylindria bacterium]
MSAMLLEERRVDPAAYAIGARAPRRAVRPASPDEVAETLRAASRDGLSVVPWGGGVGLVFEPAPERYDLALDLTALDRIVEYEP